MNVSDIMTKEVELIDPENSLFDASQKMRNADAGALPVTVQDGTVVGMITDRDIVLRAVAQDADPKGVRVREAMTPNPVTCRPDCPLEAAASTMRDRQIRRLIVTQEHNRNVLGIVSLWDIATHAEERELVGAAVEGVSQHPY